LIRQPEYKAVFANYALCEKEPAGPINKGGDKKPKGEKAKDEKPKEEKKKEEAKPKEEKPKKKKSEDDDDGGDYQEEKRVDPLASLPPAKMNMDEWKRMYSNNDTRGVALPWFFQNYDAAGYSCWFADYKDAEKYLYGEPAYKIGNLIGGFFQRLDDARKYAFGNTLVLGDDNKNHIKGVWLFRGTDIPPQVKECPDFDIYEWRQLDLNNGADKELLEDYWAWDGKLGGDKFVSGKTFK
jgi:elongation factor 1-gamma